MTADTQSFETIGGALRLAINTTNFVDDFYDWYLGLDELIFDRNDVSVLPSGSVWRDDVTAGGQADVLVLPSGSVWRDNVIAGGQADVPVLPSVQALCPS